MEFMIKPAIARVDVLVMIYNYGANEEILWVALLFLFGYPYFFVKNRVLKTIKDKNLSNKSNNLYDIWSTT